MSWNDHDHRGEYAENGHIHYDYADEHHRHYDLETDDKTAQQAITCLREEVAELRRQFDDALERIRALEGQTPQARRLQHEADLAAADLAESGYDCHGPGCRCPYCSTDEPEPDNPMSSAEAFTCCTTPIPWPTQAEDRICPECGTTWEREPIDLGAGARIKSSGCAETSDGMHCGAWYDGGRCGACGLFGPQPDDEPEPGEYDPGPEVDDEGGMSEYRGWLQ